MDFADSLAYFTKSWSEKGAALEGLQELVRIPNLSPEYDSEFFTNGLIDKAVETTKKWILSKTLRG